MLATGTHSTLALTAPVHCPGVVADVLGRHISPDEPFIAAGLDSLGAVELQKAISARVGASMPATLVFDFPTLHALAPFVAAHAQLSQLPAGSGAAVRQAPQSSGRAADVLQLTLEAVREVLGVEVEPDAPIMEVRHLPALCTRS